MFQFSDGNSNGRGNDRQTMAIHVIQFFFTRLENAKAIHNQTWNSSFLQFGNWVTSRQQFLRSSPDKFWDGRTDGQQRSDLYMLPATTCESWMAGWTETITLSSANFQAIINTT